MKLLIDSERRVDLAARHRPPDNLSLRLSAPANFSADRQHRYTLYRDLDPMGLTSGVAVWCALNPSTADETANDPTITRECNFTRAWGFRHLLKVNAFAFRSTDPKSMLSAPDPVGANNDRWLTYAFEAADIIIAAWGVHGRHQGRAGQVLQLLNAWSSKVYCLGLTKDGAPKHPLYLRGDTLPQPCTWELGKSGLIPLGLAA